MGGTSSHRERLSHNISSARLDLDLMLRETVSHLLDSEVVGGQLGVVDGEDEAAISTSSEVDLKSSKRCNET